MLYKKRSSTGSWFWYTDVIDGSWDELVLNTADAKTDFAGTYATSTTFKSVTSSSGADWVTYCFHSVDGFSKFGSYVGNGSSDGPIIETGFEPAFLMIRRTDTDPTGGAGHTWIMYDNLRSPSNPRKIRLWADGDPAEAEYTQYSIDFLSNGFQLKDGSSGFAQNTDGGEYIYMAFAADPDTEAPTVAKSFSTVTYDGTGSAGNSITGLGFAPNLVWIKSRTNTLFHNLVNSVVGENYIQYSNSNSAGETNANIVASLDSDGFTVGNDNSANQSGQDFVAWSWKADDNEPTIIGGPATLVYKFEDNANDVTGNYNGTANNITYATGKFNKAAQFNGSSSYIDTNFTLPAISSYSISFWFNTSSTDTWNDFLADNESSGSGLSSRLILAIKNGTHFHVAISNGSSFWQDNTSVGASDYVDGEWHHYAVAVNGTSVKLFVDGSLLHTYTSSVSAGTGGARSITLGRLGDYNGEYFTGKLDQFRFYSGTFEQDQVSNLYSETIGDNDDLDYGSPSTTIISANANAGFSIVKYEGDGTVSRTIPHVLSAAPEMVIVKNLSSADNWIVYNKYADSSPASGFLQLNQTAAFYVDSDAWGGGSGTEPSSTLITIGDGGTDAYTNKDGSEYIAYCFHSVSSYSKFGSYTGNGSTTGPTVTTGFQPDFVMIKATSRTGNWAMFDSVRVDGSIADKLLWANEALAEVDFSGARAIEFQSNGFQLKSGGSDDINDSSETYIYMAFKIN